MKIIKVKVMIKIIEEDGWYLKNKKVATVILGIKQKKVK